MAKIVIDARESGTSTGRYIDKLVEYLHGLKPQHNIAVLAKAHRVKYLQQVAPDFEVVETPFDEFSFGEQSGFKRQLDGLRADLVHFGMTQQPVRYRGKAVTTIHDLTTLRFSNPDKPPLVFWFKQQVYKYVVKRVARQSQALLVPSQFVKDDIVHFANIDPAKVTVTPEAAEQISQPAEPVTGLEHQRFIMYVGRPTPHKNLERLIEAFALLRAQHPKLTLVLAGKTDANYRRIERLVQQRGLKPFVFFTGFVPEGQLRWLFEHCAAYVFPSLSEGFGLPGLEAMAHGAPVVSSNATCLPEVYGEAAHYFDPVDTQAMADAINEVLTDTSLRAKLVAAGSEQVAHYSWRRMAEQTLAVYQKILGL